jgi:hypothetical protein
MISKTKSFQFNFPRCRPLRAYDGTGSLVPVHMQPPGYGTRPTKAAIILAVGFMNTMRKFALLLVLFFCGCLMAHAGIRAADFLTWISDHLQTVSYTVTTPRAAYPEFASAKMEFDGCNVKIVEDLKTQKSNIQTTVSFSLSYIQPDMIRSRLERGYGNTQVTPYFLVQLPLVGTAANTTTFTASDGSKTETAASTSVSILFQDRDLANRQANAWRDAAFACGARESISAL